MPMKESQNGLKDIKESNYLQVQYRLDIYINSALAHIISESSLFSSEPS